MLDYAHWVDAACRIIYVFWPDNHWIRYAKERRSTGSPRKSSDLLVRHAIICFATFDLVCRTSIHGQQRLSAIRCETYEKDLTDLPVPDLLWMTIFQTFVLNSAVLSVLPCSFSSRWLRSGLSLLPCRHTYSALSIDLRQWCQAKVTSYHDDTNGF